MARLIICIAALCLVVATALAQSTIPTLPPDALTPKIKVLPGPPPVKEQEPMKPAPPAASASCQCTEVADVPIYESGRVVGYNRIRRPTGVSGPQCCR